MKAAGYEMVRYADDFVILCKSQPEAEAALARVTELVERKGLTLHADKTSLVNTQQPGQSFEFLGYHFEKGTRWPNQYFRDLGYFSLYDAHRALLQSS